MAAARAQLRQAHAHHHAARGGRRGSVRGALRRRRSVPHAEEEERKPSEAPDGALIEFGVRAGTDLKVGSHLRPDSDLFSQRGTNPAISWLIVSGASICGACPTPASVRYSA